MITFDYGGGEGGLANDYVIKYHTIFGTILQFSSVFSTKMFIIFRIFFQNFFEMTTFRDRQTIFMY